MAGSKSNDALRSRSVASTGALDPGDQQQARPAQHDRRFTIAARLRRLERRQAIICPPDCPAAVVVADLLVRSASLSVTMSNHSSFCSLPRRAARRDLRGQSRSRTRAPKLLALGIFLPVGSSTTSQLFSRDRAEQAAVHFVAGKRALQSWLRRVPATRAFPPDFRKYPQKPSTLGPCRNDDCSGLPFLRGSLVEARSTAPPICLAGTHHLPKRGAVALGTARPALGRRGSVAFTQGH